jgi:NADP-dependent 3-hydroxy acid dehydrogenase YdfG
VVRTTSVSPGFVSTELADSIDNPEVRAGIEQGMVRFGLAPQAVAGAIAFAIDQPDDVEIGEIVIRPTVQD